MDVKLRHERQDVSKRALRCMLYVRHNEVGENSEKGSWYNEGSEAV